MNKSRFVSMGEQGVISLTNFVSTILLSRLLSVDDFGLFSVGFAVFVMLHGFQRAFVAIPVSVLFRRAECSDFGFGDWQAVNRWLTFFVSVIVVLLWLLIYFVDGVGVFSSGMVVGLIIYVGMASYELNRRVMIQCGLISGLLPAALIYSSVYFVAIVFFVPKAWGWIFSAFAMSAAAIVASIYSAWVVKSGLLSGVSGRQGNVRELINSLWEFGKWGGASHIVFSMYNGLVPVVLGAFLGPAAPALMHVTKNVMQPVQTLINAIDGIDKPRAAKAFDNEGFSGVLKVLRSSFFVLAVIGGAYILIASYFGSEVSTFLYGDKYKAVDSLVFLWGGVFCLMILTQPIESGLYVCRASNKLFIGRSVSAVVGLVAMAIFVPWYGIEGGMFALIAAWFVSFLFSSVALRRVGRRCA